MITTATFTPQPVYLTKVAASKIRNLTTPSVEHQKALRVFIKGGGCSGFSYGFTFTEEILEDDTKVETNGATIVVDPLSIQYLNGARIDYKEDLQGSQFIVENPNATSTCGCGNSFAISTS